MPETSKKKLDFAKLFGNATPEQRRRMQSQMQRLVGGNMDSMRGRTPTAGVAGNTTRKVQPLGSPTSTKGAIRRISPGRQPVKSNDDTKEGQKKMTQHHQGTLKFEDRLIEAILSNPNAFAMITEGRRDGWTRGADKWKKRAAITALSVAGAVGGFKGTQAAMGGGDKKPQDTHQVQKSTEKKPTAPTAHQGTGVSSDDDEIGDEGSASKRKNLPPSKEPQGPKLSPAMKERQEKVKKSQDLINQIRKATGKDKHHDAKPKGEYDPNLKGPSGQVGKDPRR